MTEKRETPRTDALIAKHTMESAAFLHPMEGYGDAIAVHSMRQTLELIEHARTLEREASELAEQLASARSTAAVKLDDLRAHLETALEALEKDDKEIISLHEQVAALQRSLRTQTNAEQRAKELHELIRRLQMMHAANADDPIWFRNAIAQALKSVGQVPRLEFDK